MEHRGWATRQSQGKPGEWRKPRGGIPMRPVHRGLSAAASAWNCDFPKPGQSPREWVPFTSLCLGSGSSLRSEWKWHRLGILATASGSLPFAISQTDRSLHIVRRHSCASHSLQTPHPWRQRVCLTQLVTPGEWWKNTYFYNKLS